MLLKLPENFNRVDILSRHHRGVVKENDDPKKLGRVKCQIKGVIESESVENLLWCYPNSSSLLGGAPDSSSFHVPEIDSELLITFFNKDIYFPVYVGYLQSTLTHQTLFDEDYPESYGFRDSGGTYVRVNKKLEDIFLVHSASSSDGSFFHIDKDGNANVNIKGDLRVKVGGKMFLRIASDFVASAASMYQTALSGFLKFFANTNIFATAGSDTNLSSGGSQNVDATTIKQNEGASTSVSGETADDNTVTPPSP
mgnify:CR=1 FL=1